ncbi:hypothetical protein [Planctomyces sp. SH-PL62]|uniref:hypothetical protein n=1 Tax=Planctomyces sp. SH-PL62 TaxID=1636152 RepID=UPI00078B3604|nr:hypothetical protein [Planctomyces sp. SH-PL62]AMV39278.1 hypothetical protein VT85_17705 [Planctomyces sp. SH-PL62]
MQPSPNQPELTPFEHSLAALAPSRNLLDRDRLMFEAGRRSALNDRRRAWGWPAVAAALAVLAVGQFISTGRRPAGLAVDRVVSVAAPTRRAVEADEPVVILTRRPPNPQAEGVGQPLRPRRRIDRQGLEALSEPPILAASARLGPLPEDPIRTLKALDGRDEELFSSLGGPL